MSRKTPAQRDADLLATLSDRFSVRFVNGSDYRATLHTEDLDVEITIRCARRVEYSEKQEHLSAALAYLGEHAYEARRCDCTLDRRSPFGVSRSCSKAPSAVVVYRSFDGVSPEGRTRWKVSFRFVCAVHSKTPPIKSDSILAILGLPSAALNRIRKGHDAAEAKRLATKHAEEGGARAIAEWLGSYRIVDELAARRSGGRP